MRRVVAVERSCSAFLAAALAACTLSVGCTSGGESDTRRVGADRLPHDAIAQSPAPEAQRESRNHGADATGTLVLRYDAARDRLTLRASDVPLATLLERLVAATGVDLVGLESLQLDEAISIELEGVPLRQAVDVLLSDFDRAVIFSNGHVVRVLLAGRRASERVGAETSPSPALSRDPAVALAQAVEMGDPNLTMSIVDKLVEGGIETEKDRAVGRLLESVDLTRRFVGSGAPVELVALLEERVRNSSDPDLRQAATDSLARLDDAAKARFLLEVAARHRELRVQNHE